jgi:hypothetical protein
MKTIDTLVEDIYSIFDTGIEIPDVLIEELGNNISKTIKERLLSYKTKKESYLRPSNLGKKDRQLYYELNNYKQEELIPSTKIKFLYGDILEQLLLMFVKLSGHTVTGEQDKLSIDGVEGSRDCVIDGVTIDIKSASSYSFNKFVDGSIRTNDAFGYITQLSYYTQGDTNTNQDEAAFLVIDKVTGKICLSKIDFLDIVDVKERIKEIRKSTNNLNEPPPKCYEDVAVGTSGNRKLSMMCFYCPFKEECWKDSNDGKGLRKFKYSTGIEYFTHVEKEPKVEEII